MIAKPCEYTDSFAKGYTLDLYHGSREALSEVNEFIHLGTLTQARMRGRIVSRFLGKPGKYKRMVDAGHNKWDTKVLNRLYNRGYDGVIYLNRFEGIELSSFEQAGGLDDISDVRFKKLIPVAVDSYIIFDPFSLRFIGEMKD